jgi:hypothetical protein
VEGGQGVADHTPPCPGPPDIPPPPPLRSPRVDVLTKMSVAVRLARGRLSLAEEKDGRMWSRAVTALPPPPPRSPAPTELEKLDRPSWGGGGGEGRVAFDRVGKKGVTDIWVLNRPILVFSLSFKICPFYV